MNNRFIESCWISLSYQKKPGTKGSYYQAGGKRGILPQRLSMGIYTQRKASIRDILKKNEINGTYKKAEEGLYKELNLGRIHSSVWGKEDYPEFYGYGVLDERYGIFDLLILYSEDNCSESFDIHIFRGMGKPEYYEAAFSHLRKSMNRKAG
jgi:hypothetical protein